MWYHSDLQYDLQSSTIIVQSYASNVGRVQSSSIQYSSAGVGVWWATADRKICASGALISPLL